MSTDDIQDIDEIEDDDGQGGDAAAITLRVEPQNPGWLIGTPFPVAVTMTNTGGEVIEVPDPQGPSPFVYELIPQDRDGIPRTLSKRSARLALRPDARRRPPVKLVSLAAGAGQQHHEDPGAYLFEPTPAGSYGLRAVFQPAGGRALLSAPVPVQLRTPEPLHLRHAAAPGIPFLSTAFVEAGADAKPTLYLRELITDGLALVGNAYPLPVADAGAIEQLALTISDQPPQYFRWVAWRIGDAVHAGFAQRWSPRLLSTPARPGLRGLDLSPIGWQYDVAEAEVAALGLGDDDRPMLATMAFGVEGADHADVSLAPTGLERLPQAWTLARSGGRGSAARYWLVAASASETDGATEAKAGLAIEAVEVGGATPGTPATLYRGDEPLTAMAISATPAAGEPFADLLLGPAGKENRTMTFLRVRLNDGEVLRRMAWRFPAQFLDRAPTASWALPPIPADEPLILTNLDGRLLAIEIDEKPRFTRVDPGPVSHPALLQTGGGLWAVWLSETTGFNAALLKKR